MQLKHDITVSRTICLFVHLFGCSDFEAKVKPISGVSVINSLVPTEHDHDDVFEQAPAMPTPKAEKSEADMGLEFKPPEPAVLPPDEQKTAPIPRTVKPPETSGSVRRGKFGRIMSQVFNRQDKRYPGLGFVQRCMGRARKSRVDSRVKIQLDNWQGSFYRFLPNIF